MLVKAVLRYGDNRGRINGVILRIVEHRCKPREKGACSFFRGAAWSRRSQTWFPAVHHLHTRLRGRRGSWRYAHRRHCRCICWSCHCPTIPSGDCPRPNTFSARCWDCRSPPVLGYHWHRMYNAHAQSAGVRGIVVFVSQRVAAHQRIRVRSKYFVQ